MNGATPNAVAAAAAEPPRVHVLEGRVADALERFKQASLAAIQEEIDRECGEESADPVFRAAIVALPDRTLVSCLPEWVRAFIEAELEKIGVP